MPQTPTAPIITIKASEKTLSENGRPLLILRMERLHFEAHSRGERRIARYYEELEHQWYRRWEAVLLPRAKLATPEQPWRVSLHYQITLLTPQYLSLIWEVTEKTNDRRPHRLRQGDIWRLPQGAPLTPSELFAPLGVRWRTTVLTEVERQINERVNSGECIFFEHCDRALHRFLRSEGLYLSEEGIQLFYPPVTIAPALEGFPHFSLSTLLPSPAAGQVAVPLSEGK